MDIKQLNCFLAVAEHLNFSRAAEALYVSQPALSHQIADMERELGGALFFRDRRSVRLTSLGSALLEPAHRTIESMEQLRATAHLGPDELRSKTLRIALDSTEDHPEFTGITRTVAEFFRDNPEIRPEIRSQTFTECVERLQFDELDLAFLLLRHNESLPTDLDRRVVNRGRLMLLVREDNPAQTCAEALEKLELGMVSGKPRGRSRMLRCFSRMGITPRVRILDSVAASFVLTQAGIIAMVFPENYLAHATGIGLRAMELDDESMDLNFSAVWKRGCLHPAAEQLLTRFHD